MGDACEPQHTFHEETMILHENEESRCIFFLNEEKENPDIFFMKDFLFFMKNLVFFFFMKVTTVPS